MVVNNWKWIDLWWNHEWYELIASKNFKNLITSYSEDFSSYVDNILQWNTKISNEKIANIKDNNLLATIYKKLYPLLPELLWLVKSQYNSTIVFKNIKNKYNIEQNVLLNIIKSIISDILHLSIWLKAEWIDENFEVFLCKIEESNWKKISFDDIIDFITAIDTTILQSIKSHIDDYKFRDWNNEKANELIDILSLERKRLIEHYLHKYDIDNNIKIRIVKLLMNEDNLTIDENSKIDNYIMHIIWYRNMYIKNHFSNI